MHHHVDEVARRCLADGIGLQPHLCWLEGHEKSADLCLGAFVFDHGFIEGELLGCVPAGQASMEDSVPDDLQLVHWIVLVELTPLLPVLDLMWAFQGIGAADHLGQLVESPSGHGARHYVVSQGGMG